MYITYTVKRFGLVLGINEKVRKSVELSVYIVKVAIMCNIGLVYVREYYIALVSSNKQRKGLLC